MNLTEDSSKSRSSSRSFVIGDNEQEEHRGGGSDGGMLDPTLTEQEEDEKEYDHDLSKSINDGNNSGIEKKNEKKSNSRRSMFRDRQIVASAAIDDVYNSSGDADEYEDVSSSTSSSVNSEKKKKKINRNNSHNNKQSKTLSPTCAVDDKTKNENNNNNNPFLGAPYTKVEYMYAICVGVLLSFNAGYVNGSCLSGLVAPSGIERAVTSHTGTTTKSALALSSGEISEFGFLSSMLLCFALGSFIAGSLTPKPTKAFRVEASYGPTFLIGAVLLTISSTLAALEVQQEQWIFYCAAAANGIQNGISSIYSKNLIRSTGVTGTTTDIGIFFGQFMRGNKTNTWKLIVLLCLWTSFWTGGLVSLFATSKFLHFSLLFNAGLFLLIGGSVVVFLRHELDVSWSQAVFGKLFEVLLAHEAAAAAIATTTTQQKQRQKQQEGEKEEEVQTQRGDASFATTTASQHNLQLQQQKSSSSSSSCEPWWANVPTDFEC